MYYKINIAHLQLDASLLAKTKENKQKKLKLAQPNQPETDRRREKM